jgi:hypothetical protein
VCRETNFRGIRTREQCCRVYQRCQQITNYYRCSVVKRKACWWTGAARGDVHLLGRDGKWVTVNVAGTFRYVSDTQRKIAVFLQFRQVGSGSDISAVAIQANGNLVQASAGKILVNGKQVTKFPAQVGTGKLTRSKKGIFVLKGFVRERVAFVRQADGSYTVDIGIRSGRKIKTTGLMNNLKNPIRYQIGEAQSKGLFASYIPFKNLVPTRRVSQADADKCCAPVKPLDLERFKQCISDAFASGKCYVKTYMKSNDKVKEEMSKK